MNNIFKLGLLSGLLVTFNSCRFGCTEGSGPVQTEKRNLSEFKSISLELAADVTVLKGEEPALIIYAQENLMEKIRTKVRGDELTITDDGCIKSDERIKITAYLSELEELEVNGSGNIKVPDTLQTGNLKLLISGSGDISGKFIAANLESEIRGSGNIILSGSANKHEMEILGSGDIKAQDLPCNSSEIKVNGSGDVFVYTIKTLDIKINGSGTVHYKGKPSVNSNVNGSGKVVDEN
jgi:hypothetical protein